MGAYSSVVNCGSALAHSFRGLRSVKEAYDFQINHQMRFLDRNCSCRLQSAANTSCTIESRERAEALEETGAPHLGSSLTCSVRTGVASSFPTFLGFPFARVIETRCVHDGAPYCRFKVDFSLAQRVLSKRQRRPPLALVRADEA